METRKVHVVPDTHPDELWAVAFYADMLDEDLTEDEVDEAVCYKISLIFSLN